MSKTTLSIEDIRKLADAKAEADNAKSKYENLRAELITDKLPAGKYFAEKIGEVIKSVSIRGIVDYKKLLEDHPEIDAEKYTEYKEITSVNVKSFQVNKGFIPRFLKN